MLCTRETLGKSGFSKADNSKNDWALPPEQRQKKIRIPPLKTFRLEINLSCFFWNCLPKRPGLRCFLWNGKSETKRNQKNQVFIRYYSIKGRKCFSTSQNKQKREHFPVSHGIISHESLWTAIALSLRGFQRENLISFPCLGFHEFQWHREENLPSCWMTTALIGDENCSKKSIFQGNLRRREKINLVIRQFSDTWSFYGSQKGHFLAK